MERKECAHGLELIKVAAIKLKGNFSTLFVGALAMTTPLILCLFLGILMSILFNSGWVFTIGLVLFVMFVAPLQMGYIKYFNNVLDGKQPRISEVYSYVRFSFLTLRSIYISGLLIIMYVLGGILWMVPAGFAISAFSMVLFFLQKFEYAKLRTAMMECAKKMIGNRLAMFAYKLIFYMVYAMLFVIAGLFLLLVYHLLVENLLISWIVAVCSAIVFIFLYTMVTVYFHSSNQVFFEDVLSRDEKKRQRKVHATINNTQQIDVIENDASKDKSKQVDDSEKDAKTQEKNTKSDKPKKEKTPKSKANKEKVAKAKKEKTK